MECGRREKRKITKKQQIPKHVSKKNKLNCRGCEKEMASEDNVWPVHQTEDIIVDKNKTTR
jgi:hypothetical protein